MILLIQLNIPDFIINPFSDLHLIWYYQIFINKIYFNLYIKSRYET
jgi:hypothetical protein